MLNLAVLISGSGSNLQALIDSCAQKKIPAQISVVFSNQENAYGLKRAKDANIPTEFLSHTNFSTRTDYDQAVLKILANYPIDLICLAGFMRILTPDFINEYAGRILNIHPSLLPDYKGLHTHRRVLEDKKSISGCSVHFVTSGLDEGPVLVQRSVPVYDTDTEETLAQRVLEQEHLAYSEAINLIAEGKICFDEKGHIVKI
jgi:phosphoribosylglycinamide formyltransferase 1